MTNVIHGGAGAGDQYGPGPSNPVSGAGAGGDRWGASPTADSNAVRIRPERREVRGALRRARPRRQGSGRRSGRGPARWPGRRSWRRCGRRRRRQEGQGHRRPRHRGPHARLGGRRRSHRRGDHERFFGRRVVVGKRLERDQCIGGAGRRPLRARPRGFDRGGRAGGPGQRRVHSGGHRSRNGLRFRLGPVLRRPGADQPARRRRGRPAGRADVGAAQRRHHTRHSTSPATGRRTSR